MVFCDDHFNVADFPRSMELGSADSDALGFAGGGGGSSTGGGGGGGGGGFLQPTNSMSCRQKTPIRSNATLRFFSMTTSTPPRNLYSLNALVYVFLITVWEKIFLRTIFC